MVHAAEERPDDDHQGDEHDPAFEIPQDAPSPGIEAEAHAHGGEHGVYGEIAGLVDKAEPVGGQEVEPAPEHAEAEKEQDDDGFLHCAAPSSFAVRETA